MSSTSAAAVPADAQARPRWSPARLLLLNDLFENGRVVMSGPGAGLLANDGLRAAYLGM